MLRSFTTFVSITLFAALALAACATDTADDGTDDGDAIQIEQTQEPETDDDPATDDTTDTTTDEASDEANGNGQDDAEPEATEEADEIEEEPTSTPVEDEDDATEESEEDADDAEDAEEVAAPAAEQTVISSEHETALVEYGDGPRITFIVPDAGEVDIDLEGMQLTLVEVRPNDGWSYDIDEQDPDEIEIDFEQQNREVDLEVEFERGMLEVEFDMEWNNAQPGTYVVGDAGEVEWGWDGQSLTLIEVRVNDGWEYHIDEQDWDGIEIDFRRGFDEVDFEVEFDDGELEVDIDIDLYFEINE